MSIQKGYKINFETMRRAFANGDVCLMECTDAKTGEPVVTVCAVLGHENEEVSFVPLAKMFDGNPYNELEPPK